jgi:hypothetical protein
MKKKLSWLLAVVMLVSLMVPMSVFAHQSLKVKVNNEVITIDKSIFGSNSRIMVPLNGVIEKMGAEVKWEAKTKKIWIEDKYTRIEMTLNKKEALVHRKYDFTGIPQKVTLKTAPKKVRNTVYVPLSFVAETLGATMKWDKDSRTVTIITRDQQAPNGPVTYKVLNREDIENNKDLLKWYEENYKKTGIHSKSNGTAAYVLVSGGVKPTGGYTLDIDSVTRTEAGRVFVTAHVRKPAPDMMVTQALTYPHKLLKLEGLKVEKVEGTIDVYNYNMTEKDLAYKILGEKDIQSGNKLAKWIEANRKTKGIYYTKVKDSLYVLVAGGVRATGGYRVEVQNVVSRKPDEAFIYAHVNHPGKDDMVIMMNTFPFALIKLDSKIIKHVGGDIKEIAE